MGKMIAILYRSEALTTAGSVADRQILSAARDRNKALNVTGFLHRESDVFYQWLEGPAEAVRQVFASIVKDARHHEVTMLTEVGVTDRQFGLWSMAYSNESDTSLFDWAARTGISLHTVRPAQILSFLLHCARRV